MSDVATRDREETGKRELIGDALILLFAREHLHVRYPKIPKHRYDALTAMLVCNATLGELAQQLGVAPLDDSPKGLARAFETHLATLYLERGLARARQAYVRLIERRFDIAATAATWHHREGVAPALRPAEESARTCEICGTDYHRRPTESRRQFAARRFCSRACAVRRERPGKRAAKRPPELVRCAECEVLFEVIPSRIARSRSGLLYCSRECQAAHRKRGGALHVRPDGPLRIAVAADARTGRYSLRELAERHGHPESTIGVILHREGIRLREVRADP